MYSEPLQIPGDILDQKYELRQALGRGGSGSVFLARHVYMDREVAIKLLHPGVQTDELFRARFFREAKLTSQLRHPNIVTVHDFGLANNTPYLVMEYVQGRTLRSLLHESGTLQLAEVIECGRQVAKALSAAHELGIVHRDLKPENIIITECQGEKQIKVLDFGIAKFFEGIPPEDSEGSYHTEEGIFQGTPRYASPEQIMNQPIDGRADIYSLGVILYEALTGMPPFSAQSSVEVAFMHVSADVVPPSKRDGEANWPPALETLVMGMLAKKPEERVSDARYVVQTLNEIERSNFVSIAKTKVLDSRFLATVLSALTLSGLVFSAGTPRALVPAAKPVILTPAVSPKPSLPSKAEQLDSLLSEGQRSYNEKLYNDAASIFRSVLSSRPNDVSAKFYLALSYRQLGRKEDALALLETMDMKFQDDQRVAYQLALLNAQVGKMDRALQHLEQAAKDNNTLREQAKKEPAFASLAKNPRYKAIVETPRETSVAQKEKPSPHRSLEQRFGSMLESANRGLKRFF